MEQDVTVKQLMQMVKDKELEMWEILRYLAKQQNNDPVTPKMISELLVEQGLYINELGHETTTSKDIIEWRVFAEKHDFLGNEGWFLPEHWMYREVLEHIEKNDVVLDIGAGNFAFSILLANKCKKVYAIEVNPTVVRSGLEILGYNLPRNLTVICGNALDYPVPSDVNTLVILLQNLEHPLPVSWGEVPNIISNIGENLRVQRDFNVVD